MKNDAYHRTKKLVHKVNLHNAAVAKLASLRLQQLYSRSDVAWVTPYDETQSMVFLPLHCVVKPSSSSTQARICIAPNVSYNTPVGPVSYNSALKNISSSQPRFYRFLLQHQTALAFAVADVSQQFNRCHFSRPSSLLNVTLAMRSRRNLPTYCVDDCDDVSLHPLRHKVCGFGGKQTPQVAQYCQQNSVKVFKTTKNACPVPQRKTLACSATFSICGRICEKKCSLHLPASLRISGFPIFHRWT